MGGKAFSSRNPDCGRASISEQPVDCQTDGSPALSVTTLRHKSARNTPAVMPAEATNQ
jgi:hypothetical protein